MSLTSNSCSGTGSSMLFVFHSNPRLCQIVNVFVLQSILGGYRKKRYSMNSFSGSLL